MRYPYTNILLIVTLTVLVISGYAGLTHGDAAGAWRLWAHGIAAYALIVQFALKGLIIADAVRRKKTWTRQRIIFIVMLFLLLVVMGMGMLWTFNGPYHIGGFSLVSLHIYVAVPMLVLVVWHSRKMKFIFKLTGSKDRRVFMGTAASALLGGMLWKSAETAQAYWRLPGATQRFTGSYERGSNTGHFPATSWIFDYPSPIDQSTFQLTVAGAVNNLLTFSLADLLAHQQTAKEVLLDCTSGWYTTQQWQGVALADLLRQAGVQEDAQSVTVRAVSGYQRRFSLREAETMLLALSVADAPLSHGHGAPVRLVVPERRGYEWVKWVTAIEVNTTSPLLQSPLPLQ